MHDLPKPAGIFPAFWIWLCAYLNTAGWTLSALHQLNTTGYVVALMLLGLGLWWWGKRTGAGWLAPTNKLRKLRRRFRRPLPAIFLGFALLVFIGGAVYAPTNYDALTYRLPRMLNWLAAGQWGWIPTINERVNFSGLAWEWIALPVLALTHSDRALFLINLCGWLMMPGLLFAIFRQLGVKQRVAWVWMWFLPLAYGYVLQAGSIGNDLTGAIFGLLAVYFGLRARKTQRAMDVWTALLAAGLMTGVKLSNLPLALPCVVAVWPALGTLRKQLAASAGVIGLAAVVSALPLMALNQHYTGSWTGDLNDTYRMQVKSPTAALLGNSLLLAQQTLMPPILPEVGRVNRALVDALPDAWNVRLKKDFPRYYLNKMNELPSEEAAGLGLGCFIILLAGLVMTVGKLSAGRAGWKTLPKPHAVVLAAWVAGLFYLLKMGSEAAPRLWLPYYPLLLIPCLWLPGQGALLRRRAGHVLVILMALSILPAMVLSAPRPLWPGRMACEHWLTQHPDQPLLKRMAAVYDTYARRNDVLAPVRNALPAEVREVGFIAGSNDSDYALWRPFGQRRVYYPRHDIRHFLESPPAGWVVIKENIWPEISPVPLSEWAATHHARIVAIIPIVELVTWGPENWFVLQIE